MALLLVIEGLGYRRAARRAGLADHRDVYRAAGRLGLRELHLRRKQELEVIRVPRREARLYEVVMSGKARGGQAFRAWVASLDRLEKIANLAGP